MPGLYILHNLYYDREVAGVLLPLCIKKAARLRALLRNP